MLDEILVSQLLAGRNVAVLVARRLSEQFLVEARLPSAFVFVVVDEHCSRFYFQEVRRLVQLILDSTRDLRLTAHRRAYLPILSLVFLRLLLLDFVRPLVLFWRSLARS
jgi:hypothetical protein